MNRSEFIHIVKASHTVGPENISELQRMVNDYPYFQTAQLLLTKTFFKTENINFEKQLRKSAAYAADRKVLHELLFNEQEPRNKPEESSKKPLIISEELEESKLKAAEESTPRKTEIVNESIEKTALISSLEDIIEEPVDSIVANSTLDQQILSSAINSSILLEVSDEIDFNDFPSKEKANAIKQKEQKEYDTNISFDESSSHSFTSWLSHFKDEESDNETWEEDLESTIFIDTENQLPTKQEFYSPAKMAKLSVQENDDLVTETLANIYADQGNFDKAIKSFEKLQLKYPEKKIYFAGRIKEIENQINTL